MRHRSLLSAACAAVALMTAVPALAQVPPAPVPAAPATPDAFTYQDMITANRLGDPQVSPDGRYVVYSVTTTDVDANSRAGSLWILDLTTPDAALPDDPGEPSLPDEVGPQAASNHSPRKRRWHTRMSIARAGARGKRPTSWVAEPATMVA